MSANPAPTSAPTIPQRPARSPANGSPAPPTIPARPKSRVDRPKSPALVNAYAQSPLNRRPESPCKPSPVIQPNQQHPTVKIPSIGQEGVEYANYDRLKAEAETEHDAEVEQHSHQHQDQHQQEEELLQHHHQPPSSQTRNIAQDLKLHSPRPSSGHTQARVTSMARNGLDNNGNDDNNNTFSSSRPSLSSRPSSMVYADSETGSDRPASNAATAANNTATTTTTTATPGTRVPMYPGAGEVQAPTPRSDSARPKASGEFPRPPDSYGLHSHDIEPTSKLEKEWYQKHPEAQERKEKVSKAMHGPRPENALSSDALNKLVRETARKNEPRSDPGYMGTPDEEIVYRATDQLVSRLHLSRPSSRPASIRSASGHPVEKDEIDDVEAVSVHIDGPEIGPHLNGTGEHEQAHETILSPALIVEHITTTESPVLAADEMDKAHHLPAAIPPMEWKTHSRASSTNGRPKGFNRKMTSSSDAIGKEPTKKSPASSNQRALPESEITPPEENPKPLFTHEPEDEQTRLDRFKNRPDLAEHRFPSKDVWEDSPDSTYLETVVDAPEPAPEGENEASELTNLHVVTPRPSAVPVEAEDEKKKKDVAGFTPPADDESQLHAAAAKEFGKKPELARASSSFDAQRHHFPSKDIWEDAPDSAHLEATIQEPDEKAEESSASGNVSPVEPPQHQQQMANKPTIPARPTRPAKRPVRSVEDKEATAAAARQPQAAADSHPPVVETKRQPPVIPMRPKPQIPARPARSRPKSPVKQDPATSATTATGAGAPLSRTTSGTSATSTGSGNGTDTTVKAAPVPKPKPAIPARPVGSKIAALQAGFLSDLNNRLKIGPHGPTPPKPQARSSSDDKEKKGDVGGEARVTPLSDARKGRAKGPARRKPAAKPVAAGDAEKVEKKSEFYFEIVKAWYIFDISEDGVLTVNSQPRVEEKEKKEEKKKEEKEKKKEEKPEEQKKEQEKKDDQERKQKDAEEVEEKSKAEARTGSEAELVKEVASSDALTASAPPTTTTTVENKAGSAVLRNPVPS
ncbi:hypothetical protein KEM54_006909 [Ascosphaera aggregata]|nr:hypothetical protein KEM54_006909 [Ascosphaera aggregata]